jgi:hypothetical protein
MVTLTIGSVETGIFSVRKEYKISIISRKRLPIFFLKLSKPKCQGWYIVRTASLGDLYTLKML